MYKLPGHNGSVNDVQFHPSEPISKLKMWLGLQCCIISDFIRLA